MSHLATDPTPDELQRRIDHMSGATVAHPLDILAAQAAVGNGRTKPPTSIRGYVEDSAFGGLLVDDDLENVRDVAWPESVRTYAQMRTDSKLAALLDGYKLQLIRAQWQLDPSGCRPEVVELVADDLGLPAQGKDTPGAARTRGVDWPEHLQYALTMLDYGHAGAELQAEIVDGRARLVGLWERPQHSIVSMHADPKTGRFTGISQELARGPFDKPELTADRLAWYVHKREGAAWWGRSLLRPAFAPWLFKKEMMRVLATSSRRFGMGVPTVEWAPTATPTPQQFSEAQKAITAARVGDQAGATMPPGAMMKLIGLSGGTPDTMGFLAWLDQQMSVSVLMQHLDLGQTASGNRALGESFIDSWLFALESLGDEIADTVTRQVAARIVAWNWGADEPVPRVVISGIGSRREVTAQSLQLLLDSGALSATPELEEWVRREFRLPARTDPRPSQTPAPQRNPAEPGPEQADVHAAAPASVPGWEGSVGPSPAQYDQPHVYARDVASGAGNCVCGRVLRNRLHVQAAPGVALPEVEAGAVRYEQPELPIAAQAELESPKVSAEEPSDEESADEEMRQVEDDSNEALLALLAAWPLLVAPLAAALASGATTAAASGALGGVGAVAVPASVVNDITTALMQSMLSLASVSADRARDHLNRQGVRLDPPTLDVAELRQQAEATAGLLVAGFRSSAARTALRFAGPDTDPHLVGDQVHNGLDDLNGTAAAQHRRPRGFVADHLGSLLHTAVHFGRMAVFGALDRLGVPVVWVADESNEDTNRCRPCWSINGFQFQNLAAARVQYPVGKYVRCEGRDRCRGTLRARVLGVTAANWNPEDQPRWPAGTPGGLGGRFRKLLSMDVGGDLDISRMSTGRLENLFAEFATENPPNEAALLKLNTELERRERQTRLEAESDPLAGVDLGAQSHDQLLGLWSQHRTREDVRSQISAEFAERQRRSRSFGDEPLVDWGQDEPNTPEQQRIDELLASGLDYRQAYADVYGGEELARQERGTGSGHTRAEVRRAYRDLITLQMLQAENDLNGHLLSPQARARGIDPLSLFSGPAARVRRWASEDLRRWWADHPRVTFAEFAQSLAGRRRDLSESAVFAADWSDQPRSRSVGPRVRPGMGVTCAWHDSDSAP